MAIVVGEGTGEYNTVDHVDDGEEASQLVLRRPSINLENRTDALKTQVDTNVDKIGDHGTIGVGGNSGDIEINRENIGPTTNMGVNGNAGDIEILRGYIGGDAAGGPNTIGPGGNAGDIVIIQDDLSTNDTINKANSALQSFPVSLQTADFAAATDNVYILDPVLATMNIQLPAPVDGMVITVKDMTGDIPAKTITLVRAAAELINGVASDLLLTSGYEAITLVSDGTNWFRTAVLGIDPTFKSITSSGAPYATLLAEPRKAGRLVYATDFKKFYFDDGVNLIEAGTGGSSGGSAITPAGGFLAALQDDFPTNAADAASYVIAADTNATYNGGNGTYEISCDKNMALATTGINFTFGGAPGFTMAPGDVLVSNGEVRKIVTTPDQVSGTIDAAFSSDVTNPPNSMVSQAVWSKDIPNIGDAGEQDRYRDLMGATIAHNKIHITTQDTSAFADTVADLYDVGSIEFSASNSGDIDDVGIPSSDTFAGVRSRPAFSNQADNYILLDNPVKERLHVVYFASSTNPNVTTEVNFLQSKVSIYEDQGINDGGFINSSFAISDNTGTSLNVVTIASVFDATEAINVSEVELTWDFVQGAAPTEADGDIEVYVEGLKVPRKYTGVIGDWWKPVPGETRKIRLSKDWAPDAVSIHVVRRQGVVDHSSVNALKLDRYHAIVVGDTTDVDSGVAHYSSIQTAINNAADGATIELLNRTFTGAVAFDKKIFLKGTGNSCVIDGTVDYNAGSSASMSQWVKFADDITVANGVTKLILTNSWIDVTNLPAAVLTDNNPTADDSDYRLVED